MELKPMILTVEYSVSLRAIKDFETFMHSW